MSKIDFENWQDDNPAPEGFHREEVDDEDVRVGSGWISPVPHLSEEEIERYEIDKEDDLRSEADDMEKDAKEDLINE